MGLPKFTVNARFWTFGLLTFTNAANALGMMVAGKWYTAIFCVVAAGACAFITWGNYRDSKGAP